MRNALSFIYNHAPDYWRRGRAEKEHGTSLRGIVMERDVAITVWSLRGALRYANATHTHLFGARRETSKEDLEKLFVPETHAFLQQIVLPRIREGQPWEGEVVAIDGWRRRIRLFGRFEPLQTPLHSPKLLCTVLHDGGDRDAVLQKLRAAKEAAERANNEKRHLIVVASHDLRQPIGALRLFAACLQRQVVASSAMRLVVDHINTSSRILEDLVNSLFDISRVGNGIGIPTISNIPMRPLFSHLHDEFAAPAASLGLRLSIVPSRLTVRSDGIIPEHILRTLIGTSMRYTRRGGIVAGCRRRKSSALLQVWDSGPPLPPRRPWDSLNSDDNRCAMPENSGLGLVISCTLAQRLGHELEIFSLPNRGNLFQIRLPLQETPQPALL